MLVSIGIPPSVFSIFPAGILSKREKSWSDKTDFRSDEKCALEHVPTGLKRKKARNIKGNLTSVRESRDFGQFEKICRSLFSWIVRPPLMRPYREAVLYFLTRPLT